MADFFHINSVADVHRFMSMEKPLHPLITVFRAWPEMDIDFSNLKMTSDLYYIGMKGKVSGSFGYGRSSYDFEEGTMTFIAPNQVTDFSNTEANVDNNGWNIIFHPDLIRRSSLGKSIKN